MKASYKGFIDSMDTEKIVGWVWDENSPEKALAIDVYIDGKVIAKGIANNFRDDLLTLGIGTGNYGFNIHFPKHTICKNTTPNIVIDGEDFPLTMINKITGQVDVIDAENISGWVYDQNFPNRLLKVEIRLGKTVIAEGLAGNFREDLVKQNIGTGYHGFSIPIPKGSISKNIIPSVFVEGEASPLLIYEEIEGYIDSITPEKISGWAWDKCCPCKSLQIEIHVDNQMIAKGMAEEFRADLLEQSIGTGYYGFSIPLPKNAVPDNKIPTVFIVGKECNLSLSLPSKIEGRVDTMESGTISGWAWDKNFPNRPLKIELRKNDDVIAEGIADNFREDLLKLKFGNGYHGFSIPILDEIASQNIIPSVFVEDEIIPLQMNNQIEGYVDSITAKKVSGWAWDKNFPSHYLKIEIRIGDEVIAEGFADKFREDLLQQNIGTGRHSFDIALPMGALPKNIIPSVFVEGGINPIQANEKIEGYIDSITSKQISGWAWDKCCHCKALKIELRFDGETIAESVADDFRNDLLEKGIGTGCYGFRISLPDGIDVKNILQNVWVTDDKRTIPIDIANLDNKVMLEKSKFEQTQSADFFKTNIAIILSDWDVGGGQLAAIRLANLLVKKFRVTIVNARPNLCNGNIEKLIDPSILKITYPTNNHIKRHVFVSKLSELLMTLGVNLLHSHVWWADCLAIDILDYYSIPWVSTLHGCQEFLARNARFEPFVTQYINKFYELINGIAYLCPKNLEFAKEIGIRPFTNIQRIFNYTPPSKTSVNFNVEDLNSHKIVFVLCSRAIMEKGWKIAINAAEIVEREYPGRITLKLIGDGPYLPKAKSIVNHKKIAHIVEFTGQIINVESALINSHVGILPSFFVSESLPNSIVEYMSTGLPIIASKVGMIDEIVESGGYPSGILFPAGDECKMSNDLAGIMIYFLNNIDEFKIFSENSKLRYQALFGSSKISNDYIEFYKKSIDFFTPARATSVCNISNNYLSDQIVVTKKVSSLKIDKENISTTYIPVYDCNTVANIFDLSKKSSGIITLNPFTKTADLNFEFNTKDLYFVLGQFNVHIYPEHILKCKILQDSCVQINAELFLSVVDTSFINEYKTVTNVDFFGPDDACHIRSTENAHENSTIKKKICIKQEFNSWYLFGKLVIKDEAPLLKYCLRILSLELEGS